jgi:hypothetical protein
MKTLTKNLIAFVIAIALAGVPPLFAQQGPRGPIDLSGEWAPLFHEDQPERIPGPDIGDYLGLPINDAARLHGDAWDASILTLPEHQCKPHPADYSPRGPANLRIWRDIDHDTQSLLAIHTHISWRQPERTSDGRPSASAGICRAHLAGIFDGQVRRRHADGDHDPSEDGVDSPQRHPAKRQGDAH